jgi:hypothetical protein
MNRLFNPFSLPDAESIYFPSLKTKFISRNGIPRKLLGGPLTQEAGAQHRGDSRSPEGSDPSGMRPNPFFDYK